MEYPVQLIPDIPVELAGQQHLLSGPEKLPDFGGNFNREGEKVE
jgi:hypothetical protein